MADPFLVKDIRPGGGHSSPDGLTAVGNTLFFNAFDGINGFELWKSDGTAAGPVLVKDILPGGSGSGPNNLTAIGNTLYFRASDGINGNELWAYPTCFLAGSLIAIPSGERPIGTLQPGDLICTADGPQPVRFISRTSHNPVILWNIDGLPICVKAGAMGDGLPRRDLYVSGGHALLLDGHLIAASALVNGSTILQTQPEDWDAHRPITYYNIELEKHELITAEGLMVESFFDSFERSGWDNYTAYLALYGSEQPLEELPLPRRADSKFQHGFRSGWRIAISSNAVMSCITACMPALID
ncbi:MAG: Hint domain-containing protein [Cyanobium sp. CZS 48M]|nr:Hint domain-containing protein [Cyanobium sp. CZS48M]